MTDSINNGDPRRSLPSIDALLGEKRVSTLIADYTREIVLDEIREILGSLRKNLRPEDKPLTREEIITLLTERLELRELDRLRPVVNASGIILHTGLGRAVLPKEAVHALSGLDRCCNLQTDLESGKRGKRNHMSQELIKRITGAEDAVIVNNNAAATLLVLAALAPGKEVIISRGQLIEIGGSFRLPDCITQSGAIMVEVGTTNKTHLRDYENALTENTGMLLKVNPSNYRIIGFSKQVPVADLVTLKKKQPLIVVDDLGCGALVDLRNYGLPYENTVQDSIAAGADISLFSGDKLISGPQAGIIVGKKEYIARIRKHPLTRMLRVCKLTDIALENTLRLFLEPETLTEKHPTLRMMTLPCKQLKKRAEALKKRFDNDTPGILATVVECESQTGGGSMPGTGIPSYGIALQPKTMSTERLSVLLRKNEPPVVARIDNNSVILDMRTLLDGDDDILHEALKSIAHCAKGR